MPANHQNQRKEARKNPPTDFRGIMPYQHLDLGLLASRTAIQYLSIFIHFGCVVIC